MVIDSVWCSFKNQSGFLHVQLALDMQKANDFNKEKLREWREKRKSTYKE